MSYVLVLADHVDGVVKKVTFELLTLARTLGEPVAVLVGAGSNADAAVASLGEYGATRVFVADAPELSAHPVAPVAELLAQVAGDVVPRSCWPPVPMARRLPPGSRPSLAAEC
jgi:electron transfer flavoprotein alpha subunit